MPRRRFARRAGGPDRGRTRQLVVACQAVDRLDRAIALVLPELSRGEARRLIAAGAVFLNGRRCRVSSRAVRSGDVVRLTLVDPTVEEPLRVLYEDDDVVAIDKPPGMPTAPTRRAACGTAQETLERQLSRGGRIRLLPVHRLDAATSGVLVFARRPAAARELSRAFREHRVAKLYVALVTGRMEAVRGSIDEPIETAHGRSRVYERGRPARTTWKILARRQEDTLVELSPRTGRTHQLRVHAHALGHPVVGDRLYGGRPAPRLMLHAAALRFPHPASGEQVEIRAPVPPELALPEGDLPTPGRARRDSPR